MKKNPIIIIFCLLYLTVIANSILIAQEAFSKEDKIRQLKLDEALLRLEKTENSMNNLEKEYKDNQSLYSNKVVTLKTLNEVREKYENAIFEYKTAKINLQNTRLDFLKDSVKIGIMHAIKYSRTEGEIDVWLEIKNISRINYHVKEDNPDNWQELLDIKDIVVSLKDPMTGIIICEPYEKQVALLKYGETKKLVFNLLKKDVDSVRVCIEYLNTKEEDNVYLKKRSLLDLPQINAFTLSQEGGLGETIKYGFTLERLSEEQKNFNLQIIGLPIEMDYRIRDLESGAVVNQIRIGGKITRKNFEIEVIIPEKLKNEMLQKNLPFYLMILELKHAKKLYQIQKKYKNKTVPLSEIKKVKSNFTELGLTPIGKGKLKINLPKKYEEISKGENIKIKIDAENNGTIGLQNIKIIADAPLDWIVKIEPESISRMEIKEKEYFRIEIIPSDELTMGEYDISFRAEAEDRGLEIESKDTMFTVKVKEKTNFFINILVILLVIGLIIGVAIFTVRLAKR